MEKLRKVVLYGSDLVTSSIGANLQNRERFHLTQIDPLLPDALHRLNKVGPDVVLFDLTLAQPDFSITVLRRNPGLLLIGIDLKNDKVLVLSGEEARLLTQEDLMHMIERRKPSG
jgi:hypothetical protein